jgi:hypothetical protein
MTADHDRKVPEGGGQLEIAVVVAELRGTNGGTGMHIDHAINALPQSVEHGMCELIRDRTMRRSWKTPVELHEVRVVSGTALEAEWIDHRDDEDRSLERQMAEPFDQRMHREHAERLVSDHSGEDGRCGRTTPEFLHLHAPGEFINSGAWEVDVPSTRLSHS